MLESISHQKFREDFNSRTQRAVKENLIPDVSINLREVLSVKLEIAEFKLKVAIISAIAFASLCLISYFILFPTILTGLSAFCLGVSAVSIGLFMITLKYLQIAANSENRRLQMPAKPSSEILV
ncbi:MAG: hypothetical protein K1060chlam1_01006 [Candidatus Anoxychlamydiales bacterium]|nr:hypothetical protein [Candidatus Anoxychlamydiales bacterium]